MDLKQHIRHVPDFPKAGILFYDITTLLRSPEGLGVTIDRLAEPYAQDSIELVVGIESRGFILGSAVAKRLGAGFVPIRKPGKLPSQCVKETYELEYGTDALEIHADAVQRGPACADRRRCAGDWRHCRRRGTTRATPRRGAPRSGVPHRVAVPEGAGKAAGREGVFECCSTNEPANPEPVGVGRLELRVS